MYGLACPQHPSEKSTVVQSLSFVIALSYISFLRSFVIARPCLSDDLCSKPHTPQFDTDQKAVLILLLLLLALQTW